MNRLQEKTDGESVSVVGYAQTAKKGCVKVLIGKPEAAMTNADKVRSMSDEELVQFMMSDPPCDALYAQSCALHNGNCEECVRDWLQAFVEGEQHAD